MATNVTDTGLDAFAERLIRLCRRAQAAMDERGYPPLTPARCPTCARPLEEHPS